MKRIFIIDWILVVGLIATIVTGLLTHIAGHTDNHLKWELLSCAHSIIGMLFCLFALWHVKMHSAWYKSLLKGGSSKKKRHITAILSVITPMAAISGLALLFIKGANTEVGLWHYGLGIAFAALGLGHLLKRIPILKKSLIKP